MKRGASHIRNPVIARVFKELNLTEPWGTGVRRIFAEAQELSLPEPKIEEIALRPRFTVYLAEPPMEQIFHSMEQIFHTMEQNFRGQGRSWLSPHGQRCCHVHPFRLVSRSDPNGTPESARAASRRVSR